MAGVDEEERAAEPADAERDDRRGDILAAFDKVTEEAEPTPQETKATEPGEAPQAKPGRARDETGKFVPKEEVQEAKPPKGRGRQSAQAELEVPSTPGKPAPKADPVDSVPASLKPGLMEDWKATPRSVREEFHRREAEQYAHLEQTKAQRAQLQEIQQAVAPYQALLQAEGGSPATSLRNYLQAATLMRQGSPLAKAQWIAKLTRTFTSQEHLNLLDQALGAEFGVQGVQPPNQEPNGYRPPQEQFRDPRVDQMLAQQQQAQQYEWQQGYQEAASEKDAWISQANPEFLPWVKNKMATLLETAAKDGEDMSYEDAYDAACRMHPEVRGVLKQREEVARSQPTSLQRSRRASVSLRPQGAVAQSGTGEANSRREDIESAWNEIMGQ